MAGKANIFPNLTRRDFIRDLAFAGGTAIVLGNMGCSRKIVEDKSSEPLHKGMVIDCHYHLQEKMLTIDELLKKMDEAGVHKTALMGCQIDPFPEPPPVLVGMLQFFLTHRSFQNIGKLFVSNFTQDGIKILGKAFVIDPDPDNEPVFKAVETCPDRFMGWVFVNPKGKKDQVAELEKYKNHPGFVGVKAHPFWNHHTPMDLLPVAERLAEMGKPLIIHAGYDEEGDFSALLEAVPDLKLILAHAGFPFYSKTWKQIKNKKNVFVDLSQTSYVGGNTTEEVVEYLGVERCVFGTDGPYGFHGKDGKFDYGFIKRRIERLFPDGGVQKRLLGDNFTEIAGI